jgi:hypothetical protein
VKSTLEGRLGWLVFTGLLVGMVVVTWLADWFVGLLSANPAIKGAQLAWLLDLVFVAAGILVAGKAVNGRWSGAFIDSRNRYSLSQVQAIAWLALVSSGVVAAGIANVIHGVKAPLDLAIPIELLAAIGLSVTTLVGSPLIRSVKRGNTPDQNQTARTFSNLGMQPESNGAQVFGVEATSPPAPPPMLGAAAPVVSFGGVAAVPPTPPPTNFSATHEGTIVTMTSPEATGWADLIRGEETGNADKVDLGKIQLLYITAVAVAVYAALMFSTLGTVGDNGAAVQLAFPALDTSFVGILALSHAGGLAYEAAPHSKTTP